jgi:hypothetical protein
MHGVVWATVFGRKEISHRPKTASIMHLARSSSIPEHFNDYE